MRKLRPREEHAGQTYSLVAAGFVNLEEKSAQHRLRDIIKNHPQFCDPTCQWRITNCAELQGV